MNKDLLKQKIIEILEDRYSMVDTLTIKSDAWHDAQDIMDLFAAESEKLVEKAKIDMYNRLYDASVGKYDNELKAATALLKEILQIKKELTNSLNSKGGANE